MSENIYQHFGSKLLKRYVRNEFLSVFFISLLTASSLFVVFDFFERVRTFIKEDSNVLDAVQYLLFKIPLIAHLMTPVAVMVAVLISLGRLSQRSEITAMRAAGLSIFAICQPLLIAGGIISLVIFAAGETIVPWATARVDEIYQLDIKKKAVKGSYSKSNFWYRAGNAFFRVGQYDSRLNILRNLTFLELSPDFRLSRRVDADYTIWEQPAVGWSMKDVVEITYNQEGRMLLSRFPKLPLVIDEAPSDFYNLKRTPESFTYLELKEHIKKLQAEGVPVNKYLVTLATKFSFPLVNVIIILVALPFALTRARSGNVATGFVAGISIGFGYHFIHAFSTSLGAAELLPVHISAWAANIIYICIGSYLLLGSE